MVCHIDKNELLEESCVLCYYTEYSVSYEPSGVWESSVLIIFVSILISIEFEFLYLLWIHDGVQIERVISRRQFT